MGAGKTTAAEALAVQLGTEAQDLDALIESHSGKSIPEIFAERGESGFRRLERDALEALSEAVGVVSLGGGTVVDPSVRQRLVRDGVLITLTADASVLASRVGAAANRPLLGDDPRADLERINELRRQAYAEAHAVIDTGSLSPGDVVERVCEVVRDQPVVVALGERTYRVEIGEGTRHRVAERARQFAKGRGIVVHDGGVDRPWPKEVQRALETLGKLPVSVRLATGEEHKEIQSVERIWDAALNAGVDRDAILVGVGGGVVGDLAAFAASTLLRGVALGQVPTTLLSMVDSSVGGKTGFNRVQGKNLVGSFYQPKFVLCDVDVLSTLPRPERIAGLAEVVKSAWLDSEASVAMLEEDADALLAGDPQATIRAVRMSVRLKAHVVQRDETEAGLRMLLNLGHTVAHGLEAAADYRGLRHGEAVALGLVAAMRVANRLGRSSWQGGERLLRLLSRLGLPTDLDRRLNERVLGFIGSDKKRRGDRIHYVVPGAPGATEIVPLGLEEVRAALRPA